MENLGTDNIEKIGTFAIDTAVLVNTVLADGKLTFRETVKVATEVGLQIPDLVKIAPLVKAELKNLTNSEAEALVKKLMYGLNTNDTDKAKSIAENILELLLVINKLSENLKK